MFVCLGEIYTSTGKVRPVTRMEALSHYQPYMVKMELDQFIYLVNDKNILGIKY